MSRVIIFTGKGGVGKTSVAAAHARKSAMDGKKTILVSTDMAHNLGDIFEMRFGKEPLKIKENLYGLEIDPNYMLEHDYRNFVTAINDMLASLPGKEMTMDEMTFFPGMDELVSLLKILDLVQSQEYDRVIVDCAPTGETLALLKFPELMCWYMEKLFPVGKVAMRILSPVSKKLFQVQLPNHAAMNDIQALYVKFIELQELLKNKEVTSIRLVTLPEKMVVEETKRNYMYMNLYNYQVDGLFINRILPKDIANDFFDDWLQIQEKYQKQLEDAFVGIPIAKIPWYDSELKGLDAVDRIVNEILTQKDLFDVKNLKCGERYEKTADGYRMRLYLPNINKKDLDLHQSKNELILKINNVKRDILLPDCMNGFEVTSAKVEQDDLIIDFEQEETV